MIGPPIFGQDPPHTGFIDEWHFNVIRTAPRIHFDFTNRFGIPCGQRIRFFNHFNVPRNER